jgi:intracellular multiplication protein IcmO
VATISYSQDKAILFAKKWARRSGKLFEHIHEIKFGATTDTAALTAICLAGLSTSPMFSEHIGSPIFAAQVVVLSVVGAAWLTWRFLEPIRDDNILESSLGIKSAPSPYKTEPGKKINGMLLGYTTDEGRPVWVDDQFLMRHLFCVGQSGVGKTVFALSLLFQQIQRGGGALMIDGKIDASNLKMIHLFCKWTGRQHDLLVINPDDPDNYPTNTYNPVLHGDPDEVTDRLLQLIPSTESNPGADHYKQEAKQALNTIIAALQACRLKFNVIDLVVLLMNQKAMIELENTLTVRAPQDEAAINFSLFLDKFRMPDWDKNNPGGIDMNKLKSTLGGIAGRLYTFGTGNFGKIMNTYDPDVVLYEAIRESKIVYVALPTMGKGTAARNFGRLVIGDLRTAISWLQRLPVNERPNPPFLALCDEAGSYVNDEWSRVPEQTRSAHVIFAPLAQTAANFQAISDELYEMVIGNAWTKVVFKVGTQGTALETAELIGMEKAIVKTMGDTTNESSSFASLKVSPGTNVGQSTGMSYQEREQEDYRVSPDALKSLDMGEAVITYGHTELFNVRIPRLVFSDEIEAATGTIEVNRYRPKGVKGADFFKNAERYLATTQIKSMQKKAFDEDRDDINKMNKKAKQIHKNLGAEDDLEVDDDE